MFAEPTGLAASLGSDPMARLQKTLTDYVVIAISPALIMTLIGSFVLFLLEVFYAGHHQTRLQFIFALFVMGTVALARISIEDGRERAILFAIPLALVMLLAVSMLVNFTGPLASLRMPVNVGLVALIWWSADKLTWDCTVLDEREDASGEGLLQTVGLDRAPAASPAGGATASPAAVKPASPATPKDWWEKFLERRRRPHAPGVWLIYFSLAALPLFGLGQRFIPARDLDGRRYVFWLLCIYVASALALLMTTSFLGLRRYLRQRKLEMPLEMAGVWLSVGSFIIVALLIVCSLLPRPSPEYSVTQLSFQIGSPNDNQASRQGMGSGGAKPTPTAAQSSGKPQPKDTLAETPAAKPGSPGPRKGTAPGEGPAASEGSSPEAGSESGKGGESAQKEQPKGSAGGEQKQPASDPRSQTPSQEKAGKPEAGKAESRNSESRPPEPGKPEPNGADANGSQSRQPQPNQSASTRPPAEKTPGSSKPQDEPRQSASQPRPPETKSGEQTPAKPAERTPATPQPPPPEQKTESSFSPLRILNSILGSVPQLLHWLYNLAFIICVGYLIWRYRHEVLNALKNFLQALRDFWAGLFGRTPAPPTVVAAPGPASPPPRPFADFPDPFATGDAARYDPRELVAYSFRALEAWSRERGCPRGEEQTPHEFAWQLGARQATLAADVRNLADLYCQAAYSTLPLTPNSVAGLQRLWLALRGLPVPPL